ncbi:MAG: hypothetical protein M3Y25_01730 [Thermoproteota archaeon]|nr:hypothetical protein [Thermoproteota archaeon]
MNESKATTFEALIKDILLLENIMLSVRSYGAVAELRIDRNTPFRIGEQWATIGDEHGQWHIHINFKEAKKAKFIIERKENGRKSYSIRIFNSMDELILRINFLNIYTSENILLEESQSRFEMLFLKYGKNESLQLAI